MANSRRPFEYPGSKAQGTRENVSTERRKLTSSVGNAYQRVDVVQHF